MAEYTRADILLDRQTTSTPHSRLLDLVPILLKLPSLHDHVIVLVVVARVKIVGIITHPGYPSSTRAAPDCYRDRCLLAGYILPRTPGPRSPVRQVEMRAAAVRGDRLVASVAHAAV